MSLEVLKNIEKAEENADVIRADAQKEAREILKAVEEASIADERAAALEHRALSQRILEEARQSAARQIETEATGEAKAREEIIASARRKLDVAANLIFERVVSNGHR